MPRAVDLLRQGRNEELWQMCCGFLTLSLEEFMSIQKRLLLEQLELLGNSPLGKKVMRGAPPRTVEEFRRRVPLTTYADYCPELLEKKEDLLPVKPELWVHSSGWSGEYPFKWIPITPAYAHELSVVLYGVGMLSCCRGWGDTSRIPDNVKLLYSVAPKPYISGTFADILRKQTPLYYLPPLEEAENMPFEDRIRLGFQQAISEGLDYFFGLSLVLSAVGDKFCQSSAKVDIRPYLTRPKALWRLARGKVRSRLEGRPLLPKDLWAIRGIIGSGVDSLVYKDKIKRLWGRQPLDLYSCTEGGVIATQTWDYDGMTFVPNLNFLEFIPEEEQLKHQMDRSYQPRTLLLDEVEAGQNYEIVISNFHGGALLRYRIGDMVRITSLRNEKLGIDIPQVVFERRADDVIELAFVRLTEKSIWQAIESTGVAYEDWIAHKNPGEPVLRILIEAKDSFQGTEADLATAITEQLLKLSNDTTRMGEVVDNLKGTIDFSVEVLLLPRGAFANYTARRRAEGADLAHLKPPHINPSEKVLALLVAKPEKIRVSKETAAAGEKIVV